MAVEFTPVVAGKSKPKMIAPKAQKSRRNAEIPVMVSNQPDSVISDTVWGRALSGVITVLEDRSYMVTVREKINNIKRVGKFYDFPMPYQPK